MHVPVPRPRNARAGFTLVELLVVVLIIGILAGLITGAAVSARSSAKRAVDKTEISQLAMALEKYKQEFGEYPPDFTFINHNIGTANDPIRLQARNDLMRHIRKRFPRYAGDIDTVSAALNSGYALADDPTSLPTGIAEARLYLDPASALAFWLGGLPEDSTSLKPSGFHANPSNPFQTGIPRTTPLFEFDTTRLVYREDDPFSDVERGMHFYPPSAKTPQGNPATVNEFSPYVYFKARRVTEAGNRYEYGYDSDPSSASFVVPSYYMHSDSTATAGMKNVAVPYLGGDDSDYNDASIMCLPGKTRQWRNLEKFQVLCPGLDGQYGETADPTPTASASTDKNRYRFSLYRHNLGQLDLDNMGDFSQGTLENELK